MWDGVHPIYAQIMSAVETKSPGVFTRGVREKFSSVGGPAQRVGKGWLVGSKWEWWTWWTWVRRSRSSKHVIIMLSSSSYSKLLNWRWLQDIISCLNSLFFSVAAFHWGFAASYESYGKISAAQEKGFATDRFVLKVVEIGIQLVWFAWNLFANVCGPISQLMEVMIQYVEAGLDESTRWSSETWASLIIYEHLWSFMTIYDPYVLECLW